MIAESDGTVVIDADTLPEEIKRLAAEHITTREGVVRTLARVSPTGVYTDDIVGAMPRSRRFRIAVQIPRYIVAYVPGLGELGLGDVDAYIENGQLILDYGVEQR